MSREQNTATLERIAQRRSAWRKVHEYVNLPRKQREGKEDIFGAQMRALRKVDDYARMMASGIQQDLKAAKQALKDEYHPSYIDIFHYLFKISDALKNVAERAAKLTERREEALKPVQTRTSLSDAELLHLQQRMEPEEKAEMERAAMLRASILKMSRRQAAKTLEAIHGNVLGERYEAAYELVHDKADRLVQAALRAFKAMDKARAKGEPGAFINALETIGQEQAEFQTSLQEFYQAHVKPLIQARRGEKEPEKKDEPTSDRGDEPEDSGQQEPDNKDEGFEEEGETPEPGGKKPERIVMPEAPEAPGVDEPLPEAYMGEQGLEFEPGELGQMNWTRHRGKFIKPIKVPVPGSAPMPSSNLLPDWQQFSDPWQGVSGGEEFAWEPAWVGPDDDRPTMKGPPIEAYNHMLGMVKQAMQAGDRKAAGRIMVTYSNALMQDGLKDEAYEARVMALELLNDDK